VFYSSKFYIPVGVVCAIYILIPFLLYSADFPYWYYHIDTILVVVFYVSISFAVGYFGKRSIKEGFWLMLTELFVAAAAIAYGMFLMMYYGLIDGWGKVFYRAIFHPLYSEIFVLVPVRLLVHHHIKSNKNVMYCLAIVHAQSHSAAMGRLMLPAIEDIMLFVVCVIIYNLFRFMLRVVSRKREKLLYRVMEMMGFHDVKPAESNASFTGSVEIQTEILMENSAIVIACVTLVVIGKQGNLFMFPFPQRKIDTATIFIIGIIQLAIGAVFDFGALFVLQKYLKMPIVDTWKTMWKNRHTFFGYFAYGLFTMGFIGSLWFAFMVPRISHCPSNDICSCAWITNCDQFLASIS
jgi:hypothetical protein